MAAHEYTVRITAKNTVTLFCDDFPLAFFSYRFGGWRVVPNTASGNPSRVSHPTLVAAGQRYKKALQALRHFESYSAADLEAIRAENS